jgi:hypothetical protein
MAIINGVGRVGVRVTSSPAPSYLLDTYSGAAAAYSLRKLSSTYSGSAIRVRRSSDNTEMNIGFNSDGSLNTSALTTFVGAGNGFVVIIYDQSGNNINQKQTTAAFQSKIVTSGVLETHNGKPVIKSDNWGYDFNNGTANVNLVYKNMFFVGKVDTQNSTGPNIIISQGIYERIWLNSSTGKMGVYKNDYGTTYPGSPIVGARTYEMTSNGLNQTLLYVNMKSMNIYMSSNGNPETLMGAWGSANAANVTFSMGAYSGDSKFNGKFNEMILWNSDQSSNKTGIETNINTYYGIYTPLDTDASAFVTAASLTDATQISAVNTLVTGLKSAGLWSKMKAIYPMVGGNATSHKFNLKDPRDLDAAYRLVFSSGWSHTSTGAKPDGVGSYADSKLIPKNNLTEFSTHISYYSRTNVWGAWDHNSEYFMGFRYNNAWWGGQSMLLRFSAQNVYSNMYMSTDQNNGGSSISSTHSGGTSFNPGSRNAYFIASRTSNVMHTLYKNNSSLLTNTIADVNPYSSINGSTTGRNFDRLLGSIYLGAINTNPGVEGYTQQECAFSTIGDGLTDSESSTLYTLVQSFQTTLGRNV